MKTLILLIVLCLVGAPMADGFGGPSKRKKRKHIRKQRAKNKAFQEQAKAFFNADAIPDYAGNGAAGNPLRADLRETGAMSAFAAQGSTIPANRVMGMATGVGQRGYSGSHTSTSLPFLETGDQGDLTFRIEQVRICEAALKELKSAPPGAAGGFRNMKFLRRLLNKVSPRQKGLVNCLFTLVSVPYLSTLASTWWMGPTTAMDITWPGAKEGIANIIELILKKNGRIGPGANLMQHATSLSQGGGVALPASLERSRSLGSKAGLRLRDR